MGATGGNKIIAFNNIIKNNSVGGFKRFGPSSMVKNNLFFNNGQPDLIELNGSVLSEGNIFAKDPLIDEKSFVPLAESPCINAGLAKISVDGSSGVDIPAEDIAGVLPDIGAVELR